MSESVALRMLSFEAGSEVDDAMIDASIKSYFKQGYFQDIWAEVDDAGVLTFHFKEKPLISKVELKGWKENDAEAIDTIVQIKVGALYDEKKIEAAKSESLKLSTKKPKSIVLSRSKKSFWKMEATK